MRSQAPKNRSRLLQKSLAVLLLIATLFAVATSLVFNRSNSMPLGLYRISYASIQRGSIVGACIPTTYATIAKARGYLDSGRCAGNTRPIMKYVVGVPGDSIEIRGSQTLVNGKALPNSSLIASDSLGRKIPNQLGKHVLRPGEYWLFSSHDTGSFDSRYYGAVTEILGVVKPFITEKEICKLNLLKNNTRC